VVAGFAGAIVAGIIVCFAVDAGAAQTSPQQVPPKQAALKQTPPKQGLARQQQKKSEPLKKDTKKETKKEKKETKQETKQEALKQESSKQEPLKSSGSQFEPLKWSDLTGWASDDHLAAFAAYQAGCRAARRKPRSDDRAQIFGALSNVCRKALALEPQDSAAARAFFEQNFQPVRIARLGEGEGLVTGYYEPVVAGSRFPSPEFSVPIYRRPRDLVADGYKQGSTAFPN
jgi:hypothetical protein